MLSCAGWVPDVPCYHLVGSFWSLAGMCPQCKGMFTGVLGSLCAGSFTWLSVNSTTLGTCQGVGEAMVVSVFMLNGRLHSLWKC